LTSGGSVAITESGPGGQILYREGGHSIRFDWEFAAGPTLALIFGPPARGWDESHPWASGRQAEIFAYVGAEIIRQKAPNAGCLFDLETGDMSIGPRAPGAPAVTGRGADAPAETDTPTDWAAVEAALTDHLSIDTRVAAALLLHQHGRLPDFDGFLAGQIRLLHRPDQGMERALRAAADHPSDTVKQALLWASWNCTDCAPHCAALLLDLTGTATAPFEAPIRGMLDRLGLHNSSFDRQTAFDALVALVGMELDPGQGM